MGDLPPPEHDVDLGYAEPRTIKFIHGGPIMSCEAWSQGERPHVE